MVARTGVDVAETADGRLCDCCRRSESSENLPGVTTAGLSGVDDGGIDADDAAIGVEAVATCCCCFSEASENLVCAGDGEGKCQCV